MDNNTCCCTMNTCCLRAKMAAGWQKQTRWIIYYVRCEEITVCFGGLVIHLPASKWQSCLLRVPSGSGASGTNMNVLPQVNVSQSPSVSPSSIHLAVYPSYHPSSFIASPSCLHFHCFSPHLLPWGLFLLTSPQSSSIFCPLVLAFLTGAHQHQLSSDNDLRRGVEEET